MKNIEVEARSFITPKKYKELKDFFDNNAKLLEESAEETIYFKAEKDLRIRKDKNFSYIIVKEGKIHDKYRKEITLKTDKKSFADLETLFLALGFELTIKWYRKIRTYKWKGIKAELGITKGYGHIIELEEITNQVSQEKVHRKLTNFLESLGVNITTRKEFEEKFLYYKKNWQELLGFRLN